MLKAASRRKEATVFMPASFDKKDELEALVKGEKYYIHTYGCQANVRDEETMRGMLEDVGYTQTDKPEEAQLIIINTCAVRENAEDKVYGEIGNLKILRKKNKNLILAICGCQKLRIWALLFGTSDIFCFVGYFPKQWGWLADRTS